MQIEQNAKQGSAAVDTPQVTGGDAGHVDGLSTDGNLSKGEDSQEISNAKPGVNGDCNDTLIAGDKLNTDGNAIDGSIKMEVGGEFAPADLDHVLSDANPDQLDVVARTGSTPNPSFAVIQTEEQAREAEIEREIEEMQPWTGHNRQHHLLRHSLNAEERGQAVLKHFQAESVADAAKMIKKMSQRDLQAKFKAVYGTKTFSNNNNWLRRKLFEAIGMDPGKSTTKKATQTGPRRRRASTAGIKATSITSTRKTRPPARYARRSKAEVEEEQNHVAEALLALADFACEAEANDGLVPGREEVSDGGLSWSGQRDVPAPKQESVFAGFDTQLPPVPPLQHTHDGQEGMGSMVEYFSMMQRMMMQSPDNHSQMIMQMMTAQQNGSPSHQSQMMQQMQQMQQIQQMQMLMALQNNPALMNAFVQNHQQGDTSQVELANHAYGHEHGHQQQSAVVGHPDLFRRA